MTDWKAIAVARGLPIPASEFEAISARLHAVELVFRPLLGNLTPDLDPAPVFHADPEEQ
ncbi:MAG TPA: hypothetical protein VJ732_15900 [Bryobacteraceae bacterium]|nr:hypothetical protein [Bryobacteraceae bacterium]